ncbi:MAG: histidine--tRNA ligase [Fimbriimonadales bacterium]
MRFQAPRGTEDILPGQSERWVWLEATFRRVCSLYNYREIRTPTFEDTNLFVRLGEGTDVVSKEMYTFSDRGGRSNSLKPEGTAPAIRAYLEHSLGAPGQITKLFYITPAFRYGRPQKGRLRESHQTGVEFIGSDSPDADAEVIELTARFYKELGMNSVTVKLNSLGESECRARFRDALLEFARPALADMPEEFRQRSERNPMRILDSKDPALQEAMLGAPVIGDFLEPESRAHFETILERLQNLVVNYEIEPRLVRGLDYYTKTVFEVQSKSLGAQSSLCGGGRYDGLVEECGGPDTPAVGVGMGIERALMAIDNRSAELPPSLDAFAVCLTECRNDFARVLKDLRKAGVRVESDPDYRSAKSQFRQADKSGALFAIVIGDEELTSGQATIRDLRESTEKKVALDALAALLLK